MKKIIEKISKIRKVSLRVGLTIVGTFLAPAIAFAVVQTLNGQTGQTQNFANDNNVTISSSNDVHSLGWSGLLPVSRGGTGAGSFTAGSILFSDGTSIAQDNSNLFWDDANNLLRLGSGSLDSGSLTANRTFTFPDTNGELLISNLDDSNSIRVKGDMLLDSNRAITFSSDTPATDSNYFSYFQSQANDRFQFGQSSDSSNGEEAILDISALTVEQEYFLPDSSGTFGLLEASQTWTGLNKFESTASSSLYVGSATKTGCIVMGDSDGSGVTYVTVNDGVLTASSTKPGICQ